MNEKLAKALEGLERSIELVREAIDRLFVALAEFARMCAHYSRVEYIADGHPYGDHEDGYSMWLRFGCQRN